MKVCTPGPGQAEAGRALSRGWGRGSPDPCVWEADKQAGCPAPPPFLPPLGAAAGCAPQELVVSFVVTQQFYEDP